MEAIILSSAKPALFGVFPIYGIIALIGGLSMIGWTYVEWNKKGYRTWDFLFLCSWITIFAIYGAKIWYMIFDPVNAFGNVNDILDVIIIVFVPAFGRSIMGSIVFVPLGIWLWQKYWGGEYRPLEILDIMVPSFFIGQAIGRWGNFANQEVYGLEVTIEQISWLPNFIVDRMFIEGAYRNPLFIYESVADVAGFVTLFVTFKVFSQYWKEGSATFGYMILYSILRIILEPMRDPQFHMCWGNLNTTMLTSTLLLFISTTLFIINNWFISFTDVHNKLNKKTMN